MPAEPGFTAEALTPKPLAPKAMEVNPLSPGESNVHNDSYNSDVTDAVLPIGINAEVTAAIEKLKQNPRPSPDLQCSSPLEAGTDEQARRQSWRRALYAQHCRDCASAGSRS